MRTAAAHFSLDAELEGQWSCQRKQYEAQPTGTEQ
jgi:hypothetical protein